MDEPRPSSQAPKPTPRQKLVTEIKVVKKFVVARQANTKLGATTAATTAKQHGDTPNLTSRTANPVLSAKKAPRAQSPSVGTKPTLKTQARSMVSAVKVAKSLKSSRNAKPTGSQNSKRSFQSKSGLPRTVSERVLQSVEGTPPRLGVQIRMFDDNEGNKDCIVVVHSIVVGLPAEQAGLQVWHPHADAHTYIDDG